eukprot:1938400-Rhodomonas_salina.1
MLILLFLAALHQKDISCAKDMPCAFHGSDVGACAQVQGSVDAAVEPRGVAAGGAHRTRRGRQGR